MLESPSDLQVSGLVTYSRSPQPFLLHRLRRRNDQWSSEFTSTDTSSHMVEIPRLSLKRTRDVGFVLVKKRLRPDRDYFDSVTASTFFFPEVVSAAIEETSVSFETPVTSTPKPRPSSIELCPPRLKRASPDQTPHCFRCNSALAMPLLR